VHDEVIRERPRHHDLPGSQYRAVRCRTVRHAAYFLMSAHAGTVAGTAPTIARIGSLYGKRTTPASVTIAVMYSAGVTSKAGLSPPIPSGAMRTPPISDTSSAAHSSMGMASPLGKEGSNVVRGATT